jgi:hypothetical protein
MFQLNTEIPFLHGGIKPGRSGQHPVKYARVERPHRKKRVRLDERLSAEIIYTVLKKLNLHQVHR